MKDFTGLELVRIYDLGSGDAIFAEDGSRPVLVVKQSCSKIRQARDRE